MADFDEQASLLSDTSQSAFRRTDALRALARRGDERTPLLLASVLEDGEHQVRREAVKALGRLGDTRVVPAIVSALEAEEDREARRAMVVALGELADPRAIGILQALVENASSGLKYAAQDALRKVREATPEPVEPEQQGETDGTEEEGEPEPQPGPAAPADEQPEPKGAPPELRKGFTGVQPEYRAGRPRSPVGETPAAPLDLQELRRRAAEGRSRAPQPRAPAAPPASPSSRPLTCARAIAWGLALGVFLPVVFLRLSCRPSRRRLRNHRARVVRTAQRPVPPRPPRPTRPPVQAVPLSKADVTTREAAAVYELCDQAIKARKAQAADGNGIGADRAIVALYVDAVESPADGPALGQEALAYYCCKPTCGQTKSQRIPLRSVETVLEHVHAKQGRERRQIEIDVPGHVKLVLHVELARGKSVNLGRLVLKRQTGGAGTSPK